MPLCVSCAASDSDPRVHRLIPAVTVRLLTNYTVDPAGIAVETRVRKL